jgi:hypothetical protein
VALPGIASSLRVGRPDHGCRPFGSASGWVDVCAVADEGVRCEATPLAALAGRPWRAENGDFRGTWDQLDLPHRSDPWPAGAVPSPCGWVPGLQRAPGQDWLPPNGLSPRLDRMSWWVNAWSRIPLIDRYADVYMWNHGGWETLPAPSSPT